MIREWVGTGAINIFGVPFSGKDTVGKRLAEAIGGKFLSSGAIIRERAGEELAHVHSAGDLTPTELFREWVLPYFYREDMEEDPLVLSSIGRWAGEEDDVMRTARRAGHEIWAAVSLELSENEVWNRWSASEGVGDRAERPDDMDAKIIEKRLEEFKEKTVPVIRRYRELGLAVSVRAEGTRGEVFESVINALYEYGKKNSAG